MDANGNLLIADMKKAVIDTFENFITSVDTRIPKIKQVQKEYEDAKGVLREQIDRLHKGLEKFDRFTEPDKLSKLQQNMVRVAKEDVGDAFGDFIHTFLELVKEYGRP